MTELSECTVGELALQLEAAGFRPSHAGALLRSYFRGKAEEGTNGRTFPPGLRELLENQLGRRSARVALKSVAEDGTAKLLLRFADGRTAESVLMPGDRDDRAAGCVSSQVGCAMGCDFCATTKGGFERNLTSGEIVEQFMCLRDEANRLGRRLQTVVFMGMGEPMLNLGNVCAAIERMARNEMGGLGFRQITVSTVGIVSGIDALAATGFNVNLAVSLHAPDDATRARLIPTGRRFGVRDILEAADRYQATTARPVSIQYCLLGGVNDSIAQADSLAALVNVRRMHVNLLNYNPTGISLRGENYQRSSQQAADAFLTRLRERGVVTHIRRSRGPDIDAACGQLREAVGRQA